MSVVSNSSPLIALAQIQRLDLVPAILPSVLIPPAVVREIAPSIPVLPQWATVRAPKSRPSVLTSPGRLGDGEREAIALAIEVGAVAIVLDDRPARRAAEAAGLNAIGTLGLLLEAKRKGLVTRVRPEIDNLVATSFFLSRPSIRATAGDGRRIRRGRSGGPTDKGVRHSPGRAVGRR